MLEGDRLSWIEGGSLYASWSLVGEPDRMGMIVVDYSEDLDIARRDVANHENPTDLAGTKHTVEFEEIGVIPNYPDRKVNPLPGQLMVHTEHKAAEESIVL